MKALILIVLLLPGCVNIYESNGYVDRVCNHPVFGRYHCRNEQVIRPEYRWERVPLAPWLRNRPDVGIFE